jgi:glycosyltransferase involved in cell wall biosynthesis
MNISVIIPIHEYNEVVKNYLDKAIESIVKQENATEAPNLVVVYPPEIEEQVKSHTYANLQVTYVKNEEKTDYQSQVNLAVKSVTTDYFTVLEFDDEYSTTFFKNANKYVQSYPDIDVFLTMMIEVNEKNEGIKLTNETVWAQQFVGENGEMGYLNANALKQYTDFKLSGAVIKKSEFLNIGGYKSNIKLSFMYEFLLRALNNACKVFSMPKIGYKHLASREDSLFDGYLKTMSMNERKFWFDVATTEANFTTDRTIDTSRLNLQVVHKQ